MNTINEDDTLEDDLPPQDQTEDDGTADPPQDGESDAEIEARAKRAGWVSEDDWDDARAEREGRRRPKKFVTAQEYLDRVENELPILRSTIRRLDKTLAETDAKLSDSTRKVDEMHQIFQDQRRMTKEAVERARQEERAKLQRQMDDAVETADTDAYREAKKKMADIDAAERDAPPPKTEPQRPQTDPVVDGWIADNAKWFNVDEDSTAFMTHKFGALKKANPGMSNRDILEKAKAETIRRFPEKFREAGGRPAAPQVSSPTGDRPMPAGIEARFNAIPAEHKAAYERTRKMLEERGGKFTKAQFLEDYGL